MSAAVERARPLLEDDHPFVVPIVDGLDVLEGLDAIEAFSDAFGAERVVGGRGEVLPQPKSSPWERSLTRPAAASSAWLSPSRKPASAPKSPSTSTPRCRESREKEPQRRQDAEKKIRRDAKTQGERRGGFLARAHEYERSLSTAALGTDSLNLSLRLGVSAAAPSPRCLCGCLGVSPRRLCGSPSSYPDISRIKKGWPAARPAGSSRWARGAGVR